MVPYDKVRPKYYNEWLKIKKAKWLKLMDDRIEEGRRQGLIGRDEKVQVKLSTKDQLK